MIPRVGARGEDDGGGVDVACLRVREETLLMANVSNFRGYGFSVHSEVVVVVVVFIIGECRKMVDERPWILTSPNTNRLSTRHSFDLGEISFRWKQQRTSLELHSRGLQVFAEKEREEITYVHRNKTASNSKHDKNVENRDEYLDLKVVLLTSQGFDQMENAIICNSYEIEEIFVSKYKCSVLDVLNDQMGNAIICQIDEIFC
ncbi:TRIO and F-actin-binding protein [Striga asiatica]|uniref:TRIO and F-actin-binding protein n=1 Tax=Striga asiatica TaxID=4170 RepID=A0A5A7PNS4_STRAF|nr:TRIO and F-actin-binding protein [Striga asiatica]